MTIRRSPSNAEGLKETKTGKVRQVVPIEGGHSLATLAEDTLAEGTFADDVRKSYVIDSPMFTTDRGTRINQKWMGKQWRATCARAGVVGMRFHDIPTPAARPSQASSG